MEKYYEFLKEVKSNRKARSNYPDLAAYLRSLGARMLTYKQLKKLNPDIKIKKEHRELHLMVRACKYRSNIYKCEFDFNLIITFDWLKHKDVCHIYIGGEHVEDYELEWPEGVKKNIKTLKKRKFPDAMTMDERMDWRNIEKKVSEGRMEPNAFYLKWLPDITEMNKNL